MSADIFISFASQDFKTARTICHALENRGFQCWIASRDIRPGENFQSAIVHAIRQAKVLLLVFTANSNRSDEVTKELALASQQKLMVVPLRVENVNPSDAFAYEFATRQWIDLFADWEQALNQLSDRLSAALADDRSQTDTIVLGKPSLQDPKEAQKRASARRRILAIGIGAVIVAAAVAGLVVPRLLSKPVPVAVAVEHSAAAAPPASLPALSTPVAAASAPGKAASAPVAAASAADATSAPSAAALVAAASEPASAPKPRHKNPAKATSKPGGGSSLPY